MSSDVSKSWFCVFNNPTEHGYSGTPEEIVNQIIDEWCNGYPTRSASVIFCISADGLPHIHAVFEDVKAMRFSTVKKVFPSMHIEATKGNKKQAEDYINKRGHFAEKGEQIIYSNSIGEIKGAQGKRNDLTIIGELVEQGLTPSEILEMNFSYRRYETMIRKAYFDKLIKLTPPKRDVRVIWHCGKAGSGKTYTYVQLCEKYGEDSVYLLTDYGKGGLDNYQGQTYLCMDEFRGQIPFSTLMNYLDGYKVQIPCRYANAYALWNEIHIFTVMPPELVYKKMVEENRGIDSYDQLARRIKSIVYHWNVGQEYHSYELSMSEYIDYEDLKNRALKEYDFHSATYEQQQLFN